MKIKMPLRFLRFFAKYPGLTVVFLGTLLTLIATFSSWYVVREEEKRRFREAIDGIESPIKSRLIRYENALIQARAFFIVQDLKVNRNKFNDYVSEMRLLTKYPGARALGYAVTVPKANMGPDGSFFHLNQKYRLWPLQPERETYFAITYLFPEDSRNKKAIGYDMFSNDIRRQAMERARDTGEAASSGRVVLVQDADIATEPGFLLYLPVYKADSDPTTVEDRRKFLVGFVYSPFNSRELIQSIHPVDNKRIGFKLYTDQISADKLLYQNSDKTPTLFDYRDVREFEFAGQTFILESVSNASFVGWMQRSFPFVVLLFGSLLTGVIVFSISRIRKNMILEKESRKIVETLFGIGQKVSAELDLEKLVQEITDAATRVARAQFGALFYNVINSEGKSYTLYSLSGAPREAFSKFPLPRNTKVFNPTFTNEAIVRSDDITKDPRYGQNSPHKGMPQGHLPVRSYLAVPVVSRTGEVLGGLFFGHKDVGVFTEKEEKLVVGLAAQAAISIDNANLYKRAQESIRARDEFLSLCSHELKTPLTSLKLEAQINERLLKKQGDAALTPERFKEMISVLKNQTTNLNRLVDDMLDIGRISTGHLKLSLEETSLQQITTEVIRQAEPLFQAQNVEFIVEKLESDIEFKCDKHRVSQILNNLFSNALKYGEGKPVKFQVSIVGDEIEFEIEDRGPGINKEHHERIFSRFERVNPDANISGLGLGLFVSRRLAEAHQGSLVVKSELGQGCRFILRLPLHT